MNIKFDIFNSRNNVDEIIQFNNIKDLNDGFRKLFNKVKNNIDDYCDNYPYGSCDDYPDIDEDNINEYDFVNHEDFNFILDGVPHYFLINEYEIF